MMNDKQATYTMKLLRNYIKTCLALTTACIISACTSANVEQSLPPTPAAPTLPVISQTQPIVPDSNTAQQTAVNALTSQQTPTPAQNVTQGQLTQTPTLTQQAPATQQIASLDTSKAVTFLPFEGAPRVKATSINRLLSSTARNNNLSVLPATRAGAKYKVKGYFSALTDGNGTLLVYVWDVTDNTGRRLHRINGRERSGLTKSDPWEAISDRQIESMTNKTTARLKAWVDKRA